MKITNDISGSKIIYKKQENPAARNKMPGFCASNPEVISKEANTSISNVAKARIALDAIPPGYEDAAKLLDTLKNNPDYVNIKKILDKYALVYIEGQKFLNYEKGIKVFDFLKSKDEKRLFENADLISRVFQYQRINDLALVFDRIKQNNIYQLSFPFYEIENYGLKNTYDLAEIIDYINKKSSLNSSHVDLDALSHYMEEADSRGEIIDFKPEKIKPFLDKLDHISKNAGEKTFGLVEANGLYNKVLMTNGRYVDEINPERFNVVKEFARDPETEKLVSKLFSEMPDFITDKTLDNKLLLKNAEIIQNYVKSKSNLFKKEMEISPLLTFQGDLNKLLNKITNTVSSLDNHYTSYMINPENSRVLINDSDRFINVYDSKMNSLFQEVRSGVNYYDKVVYNTRVTDKIHDVFFDVNEYSKKYNGSLTLSEIIKTSDTGKEVLTESNIDGIYNYERISKDGVKTPLIQTIQEENGISYEKQLESFDGTTSHIKYNKSKTFEKFDYVIKDNEKNILAQKHASVKKLSENVYEHIINGTKFLVKHSSNGLSVFNEKQGTEKIINYDELLYDKKEEFVSIFKTLWADELEVFADRVKSIKAVQGLFNSYILPGTPGVKSAKIYCVPQKTVLMHEIGHEKFGDLEKNNEFLKIFEEECRLFKNNMPPVLQDTMAYFLEKNKTSKREIKISAGEAAADVNVILNSPFFLKQTCSRTHFLQQYFPKTIAFIIRHHI